MSTCKTCVHWKRNEKKYPDKHVRYPKEYLFYGSCASPKFNYMDCNENEKDNLIYQDAEYYSASLETGEDFGCIHYKEKTDAC